MKISLTTARRLALHCQGLDGSWQRPGASVLPPGKAGVAQAIERLGYVQIDTIHTIQRAHHHVLWSRCPGYDPQMLHALQAQDRRVFEWWTHAASYIPMSDFRFYAPRMGEHALSSRQKTWLQENQEVADRVLARIREEGALGTGAFSVPEGFTGGSWWSGWKPAKRALEVFFNLGTVMVSERRNFERIYDLRERIVPDNGHFTEPDSDELDVFIIRRSVGTLGVVPQTEVTWWRDVRPSEDALARAVACQMITPVEVEGAEGEPWYAWTAALEAVDAMGGDPAAWLHILSPFDNLIIRRRLMERLFDGFDYRLECYLPQEKRRYGYFCLPLLWGDRFIGRVDTKADRKPRVLIVRQLTFEPGFEDYDRILPLLAEKLLVFAAFNDCDAVTVEQVTPKAVRLPLIRALEARG